jgi:energy-coupling factor transporter ATP-binding protein EcfA2
LKRQNSKCWKESIDTMITLHHVYYKSKNSIILNDVTCLFQQSKLNVIMGPPQSGKVAISFNFSLINQKFIVYIDGIDRWAPKRWSFFW